MSMTRIPVTKIVVEDLDSDDDDDELNACVKSRELFDFCDVENKGYITSTDLQRLKNDLSLTDSQLKEVFATLDENQDGRLEMDEFSGGFGMFVAIATNQCSRKRSKKCPTVNSRALSPISELVDDPYEDFLEVIGCRQFVKDEFLRSMWKQIVEKNPSMLSDFEDFLMRAANEIDKAKDGCNNLQTTYTTQRHENDKHLRQMYESLEKKMAAEKAKLVAEESLKSGKSQQQLAEEVKHKNDLLESVKSEHDALKDKIFQLKAEEVYRRNQNALLEKERDELEKKLRMAEDMRQDVENECKNLSEEGFKTKLRRETNAKSLSSELSIEEELIAVEIEKLQNENKRLLDRKDIISSCNKILENAEDILNFEEDDETIPSSNIQLNSPSRRGSSLYQYLHKDEHFSEESTSFEETFENSLNFLNSARIDIQPTTIVETSFENHLLFEQNPKVTWKVTCKNVVNNLREFQECWKVAMKFVPPNHQRFINQSLILQVPMEAPQTAWKVLPSLQLRELEFKIIFIGDCGVGKTSFIQRFCDDTFRSVFQSTIGMDFQEKEITVDGHRTLLKLWDTAGQERFRSICKQYFRGIDGAVVMYDVTNETSYQNVREWMNSIKECNEDCIVVLLIGNKIDASKRQIQRSLGVQLAHEYGATFFETSAKTGTNVQTAMLELATSLLKKTYHTKDKRLKLRAQNQKHKKKNWWC